MVQRLIRWVHKQVIIWRNDLGLGYTHVPQTFPQNVQLNNIPPSSQQNNPQPTPLLTNPPPNPFPSQLTTLYVVIFFAVFSILLLRVAGQPKATGLAIAFYAYLGLGLLGFVILFGSDAWAYGVRRNTSYVRNLGNTVCSLLFSIVVLFAVYKHFWQKSLSKSILQFKEETVDSTRWPSLAFFQRVDWSSQANLTSGLSKCGLGWLPSDGSRCATERVASIPCRCDDAWEQNVKENFVWNNVTYRYLAMRSPPSFVCTSEATEMIAQSFFYFNSTAALFDSSQMLQPSLFVAIHDPSLTLIDALEKGYTRLTLINANGMTAISLGLRHRQIGKDTRFAYDYTMTVSTIPAQSLVCDLGSTSNPATGPCHTSLFLQFPTFQQSVIAESSEMDVLAVIQAAGAFISFVQLFSWVLSSAAFNVN